MAGAKCCDRCKKFYLKNEYVVDRRVSVHPVIGFNYRTSQNGLYPIIDLCDNCLKDLGDWMLAYKEEL